MCCISPLPASLLEALCFASERAPYQSRFLLQLKHTIPSKKKKTYCNAQFSFQHTKGDKHFSQCSAFHIHAGIVNYFKMECAISVSRCGEGLYLLASCVHRLIYPETSSSSCIAFNYVPERRVTARSSLFLLSLKLKCIFSSYSQELRV